MSKKYKVKTQVLGPEKHNQQEIRILNRIVRWTKEGLEYEPDQRHGELIVKELGLEGANSLSSPGVPENAKAQDEEDEGEAWKEKEPGKFRAIAARLNYLAVDRPDLQYASKCTSKYM